MEIFKSFRLFFIGVLKKFYLLIPSLFTDPWDIMERWFQVSYEPSQFFFWILLILGLTIAIIWTYHELRMQNVDLKKQLNENKSDFHFEFNDDSMTTKDNRLFLGVTFFSSTNRIIDNLLLEYNGKQFRPSDWAPFRLKRIHTKNYTFDLDKIRAVSSSENKDARFLVMVDNIKHESSSFNIYDLL